MDTKIVQWFLNFNSEKKVSQWRKLIFSDLPEKMYTLQWRIRYIYCKLRKNELQLGSAC